MTQKDYKKDFIKCLESINRSKNSYDIFQDFLTLASLSLRNVVLKDKAIEQEHKILWQQYDNSQKFAELLGIVTLALDQRFQDFLGEVFMAAGFGNKSNGQFFTPYHVSKLMAEVSVNYDQIIQDIEEKGYFTMSDPCCGAGSMFIALAESLLEKGLNPQKVLLFQGIDIDLKCCQMAYIQTSLLGLSGAILHGNTITLEIWKTFITPLSYINNNYICNKEQILTPTTAKIIPFNRNNNVIESKVR